jgi:hypothetical protein
MDGLLQNVGLTMGDVVLVVVVGLVLVVGWTLLRYALKLAMLPFRVGCAAIVLIVLAILAINLFGGG